MKLALKAVLALAFAAYPVGIYFGLARAGLLPVACLLGTLALLRLALFRKEGKLRKASIAMLAVALVAAVASAVTRDSVWLRYYPALINAIGLCTFGWSLLHPPSMVENFARLHTPDLTAKGVKWTRSVTMVWCVFFALNGLTAWYTARFTSLGTWTVYNGLVAYVLIGLLLAGELLMRPRSARR